MEEYMTTKQLAEVAGVSEDTISRAIKKIYPDKISQGCKIKLTKDEAWEIIKNIKKKNIILPQIEDTLPQIAEVVKTIVKETILELKKEIISEIKSETKSLPKPKSQTDANEINIDFEWLYPSRLAKYLECKTKWIYDALYQLQMLSLDKFTGSYKITDKGQEFLKWYNNSLMIRNVLITDIKRIVSIWKKNSTSLF